MKIELGWWWLGIWVSVSVGLAWGGFGGVDVG